MWCTNRTAKMLLCKSCCLHQLMRTLHHTIKLSSTNLHRIVGIQTKHTTAKSENSIPVIQYPIRMKQLLKHRNEKKSKFIKKSGLLKLARPGKMLISGDDPDSVMYTNEYATKFSPPTLTSTTWTSRKSPGRHFTIHATRQNPAFKEELKTFKDLGLDPVINDALLLANVENPTVIQEKAVPHILEGNNVMFAAETGSGKTFAYLLPIMQFLLRQKAESHENDSFAFTSPYVLVLTPTQELSMQVVRMAESLKLPIHCRALHGASLLKRRKKSLSAAEIVVATPIPLILALKQRKLDLSGLRFAVIDECDTLFDDSFASNVIHILNRFNIHEGRRTPLLSSQAAQLVLCSATFPDYAGPKMEEIISMDHVTVVRSGHLHRVTPHVTHKFVRVKPSQKLATLLKLLEKPSKTSAVVFCNQRRTVNDVFAACVENGFPVWKIDGRDSSQERRKTIEEFLQGRGAVMVTTDITSRGLDTQNVSHVINFDVPDHISDYLHRCGRVGRVGQRHDGLVTSLVSRRWEIKTVMKVEEAAKRRTEISAVSANIKHKHEHRWQEKEGEMELV